MGPHGGSASCFQLRFELHSFLTRVVWQLGYPDRAMRHGTQALAIAKELAHRLCHQAVGFVVSPEPAVALGHAQAEEPLGAEVGKGRVAVMGLGARGKALAGQTAGMGNQFAPGCRARLWAL